MAEILHLSTFLRRPIFDQDGDRIGRVQDLVARLGDDAHPPIVGAVIRIEGRNLFVPIRKIGGLSEGRMTFEGSRVDLRRFERRPGELLLAEDLLARHLINLVRGRLIIANEIEIAQIDGRWEVVGVDPGRRPFFRRVLGQKMGQRVKADSIVDFASIEPFVSHVPSARLRIPYRKLAKLHPAQIADLVEQASHEEGEEIIEAVGHDRELEADVFEELDEHHQLEFIRERSDAEVAAVIARMASDDAADLIVEIDQERRGRILARLPAAQRRRIEALLGYNPSTAGGLMSPEFISLREGDSAGAAIEKARSSSVAPSSAMIVYMCSEHGCLQGSSSLVTLLRAGADTRLEEIVEREPISVKTDADLPEVARTMTDYNLLMLPVLDHDERMVGVVTVDDVLELTLPAGWRRRFGVVRD